MHDYQKSHSLDNVNNGNNNNTFYNVFICDEKMLYSSLFAWRDLELTSVFQGDHEIIYDNTYGKLETAENTNYIYTFLRGGHCGES